MACRRVQNNDAIAGYFLSYYDLIMYIIIVVVAAASVREQSLSARLSPDRHRRAAKQYVGFAAPGRHAGRPEATPMQ